MAHRNNPFIVADASKLDLDDVEYVDVMLAGDQHIGDRCRDPAYMRFIREWVLAEPGRYLVLTGDLFNAALVNSKSDTYLETCTLDEAMGLARGWLADLAPRIVAHVDGNHDRRVDRVVGIDPVAHASLEAGCRYDGAEAYVTLQVGRDRHYSGRKPYSYDLYVTHGVGGGRTAGGKINSLMRLREIVVADIYAMGHQHDPAIKPARTRRWTTDHAHIESVPQLLIVTPGGMVRGGYAVEMAYPDTGSWGIPVVRLSGKRKAMEARLLVP